MTAEERLKSGIARHTEMILNLKTRHLREEDSTTKREITSEIKRQRLFREALEYALNFVQGDHQDDPRSD